MSSQRRGGNEGGFRGEYGWGQRGLLAPRQMEKDLLCSARTPQRLDIKSPSAQASMTELNSSKLAPI